MMKITMYDNQYGRSKLSSEDKFDSIFYSPLIDYRSYANAIKGICTALNIDSAHAIHIGRCVGAVTADMLELQTEETKVLGNWRPDTHESTYSSKLPLLALRAMGGH